MCCVVALAVSSTVRTAPISGCGAVRVAKAARLGSRTALVAAPTSRRNGDRVNDARQYLESLVGQTILTLTGKPNFILEVRGTDVIVGTAKSPKGQPVPIRWVQDAMDQLERGRELEINVQTVGYRSAFIGAVLATLPGVVGCTRPRRVLHPNAP